MSMPALTVGPGLRCNIDTTWCAKVACLLSSSLPYAAEITHIQRLNPGWRATSIIELYIWLSVDPGSLSSIYTIPSVAEYMDVAEGGLGSGYWGATARPPTTYRCNIFDMTTYPWGQFLFCASHPTRPRHDGKPFGFAAALSRGWVTSSYQTFNDLVAYISDVQNMAIESFGVLSTWNERTSVMRKVHSLERQDLIKEMRIACMASDITRLTTLPQLMGPPSPHDCTVAYIELGSAPLCVLLGVSTEQKDRWLLQNETSSQHACIHLGVLNTVGKSDVGT
ncbi:unnamed protein product [Fusarium graminearum]|nr:unnamed protein product [Fusarium graminearum]